MKTTILKTLLCTGLFISALTSTTLAETPTYTEEPVKNVEVSVNIPSSYTWSVPSRVDFSNTEKEKTFTITIDNVVISPTKKVKVSFNYDNSDNYDLNKDAFILRDNTVLDNENELYYKVYSTTDTSLNNNEAIIEATDTVSTDFKLKLLEDGNFKVAGTYTSRLVFTSKIA